MPLHPRSRSSADLWTAIEADDTPLVGDTWKRPPSSLSAGDLWKVLDGRIEARERRVQGGLPVLPDGPVKPPPSTCSDAVPPDDVSSEGLTARLTPWTAHRLPEYDADPWDAAFAGTYRSYVYRLTFSCPVEASFPRGRIETPHPRRVMQFTTYLRVNLPCFNLTAARDHVGLVLYVEGAKDVADAVQATEAEETEETRYILGWLASGLEYPWTPGVPLAGNTYIPYFRPGDPVISFHLTQPGRGEGALASTGAPDFVGDTPGNSTGMDYGGEQTVAAIEAAVDAVRAIVAALQQEAWKGTPLETAPTRLVVTSFSNGLTAATHWIGHTTQSVHGLVDREGPTAAAEQLLLTMALAPYSGGAVEADFDLWADWFAVYREPPFDVGPFHVVGRIVPVENWQLRPPPEVMDTWPADWSAPTSAMTWVQAAFGESWIRYDPSSYEVYPDALAEQVDTFWDHRQASRWLPDLQQKDIQYCRIQEVRDHAQPEHMKNRHAIRALNAAFAGPGLGGVYFTDQAYWDAVSYTGGEEAPNVMTNQFNEDDSSTFPGWIDPWDPFMNQRLDPRQWAWQVDLVRWLMAT